MAIDMKKIKGLVEKNIKDIKDVADVIAIGSEDIKDGIKEVIEASNKKAKKTHRHLITSALPYVNNEPHLGNLLQVLSADVFARYSRLKGYETFYVCGTDEYGTATELKALDENMSPYDLCTKYNALHREIYDWFNIQFDHFGRTSCKKHIEITQQVFSALDKNGYISEGSIKQYYCPQCNMFLADRYIEGVCPKCGGKAKGDQCEVCGALLDPSDLKEAKCSRCGTAPEERTSKHLFIDLPKALPLLKKWVTKASSDGFWAQNAVSITNAWIKAGLQKRCITRDLKWGIPVNKKGYEDKVFYVWFDAPIAYISMTAEVRKDWESWWKNRDEVRLYQFIGKDNIPFHTVIFPTSLLASGNDWTMLHHISSTEYLNYEEGKFSKSRGVGVFGSDCKDTGIGPDVWRFYLFYNRPEKGDYTFLWDDFEKKINGELVGNLSNLVNRTLTFISKFMDGDVPTTCLDRNFLKLVKEKEARITTLFEGVKERDALHAILELSDEGNKYFQDNEPWKLIKENPTLCKKVLGSLAVLVKDLAVLFAPYMPEASKKVLSFFGIENGSWDLLSKPIAKGTKITKLEHLFDRIDHKRIEELKERFSGKSKEVKEVKEKKEKDNMISQENESIKDTFARRVTLKVSKIVNIERHPGGDKLYILTLDTGEEEKRTIVSSIVPFYKEDELLNHNIILVSNLKPANFRGVKSCGMLLAASLKEDQNHETCEVLFADDIEVGSILLPEGTSREVEPDCYIKAEHFFNLPMYTENGILSIDGVKFISKDNKTVSAHKYINGNVG